MSHLLVILVGLLLVPVASKTMATLSQWLERLKVRDKMNGLGLRLYRWSNRPWGAK